MNTTFKDILKHIVAFKLQLVCRLILARHKPIVIAITGSVGKTATKDMMAHVLSHFTTVGSGKKSFNSDFGVPLTIIGAENPWGSTIGWLRVIWRGLEVAFSEDYPKVLVVEVGARFPGDIARLSKWLKPDIAIITHIPEIPVHIEFFNSRQDLIDEKSSIAKYLKQGGTLILNHDEEDVFNIAKESLHKVVGIGFDMGADIRAKDIMPKVFEDGRYGVSSTIAIGEHFYNINLPGFIAPHQLYSVLFVLAVVDTLGYDVAEAIMYFENLPRTPGRLNPIKGINDTLVLDDSYNASPVAVMAALSALKNLQGNGRKIAVLGDMLDLGKMTREAHENIGRTLHEHSDQAILVGPRMRFAYDIAVNNFGQDSIIHFEGADEARNHLLAMLKPGDTILVKGSQGIRMEKIVAEIIADKEHALDLLVRQDEEWKRR